MNVDSPEAAQWSETMHLKSENEQMEWVLLNAGFRRCDIPACNCGSWHQVGGFYARFREIEEVVQEAGYSVNGRPLLESVKAMAADALDGWRPIETAPKDRTILITGRYPTGRAYVEESYWTPKGHFCARQLDPPTHWMPMPQPHGGWDVDPSALGE